MKQIIIINGSGSSGKDTFCKKCNLYARCKVISTVDKVKEAYGILGWDGDKSDVFRKALSDIKDISTETLDHPYKYVVENINQFNSEDDKNKILFVHSREPTEIARFVKDFDCITVLVRGGKAKKNYTNHADLEVDNYPYDYIIDNNGTLDDLEYKAIAFLKQIGGI